ncbi:MAG: YidC/Oxa1 family membrane protein insertase [Negativicutes bacterium]|nr:YidC/Oxa1 family membrane protein insertase [Negativicutes bacterium]
MQVALTYCYNATAALGFPNYGIAIILLTVVIKMLLYPLTIKQVRSMKAMQDLSPKMKALQEKYKDNKERLNQEVAKLYKESGVNPLSGCLPLVIQMPFFIAIFFAIREYSYVSDPSFLWIKDLSQSTPSDPYYILPFLAAFTTYISTKQTATDSSQQTKMMAIFMPLFIGYITISFPAGLGLYWVVSNVVQIVQQWWLYKGTATQGGAR